MSFSMDLPMYSASFWNKTFVSSSVRGLIVRFVLIDLEGFVTNAWKGFLLICSFPRKFDWF